MLCSIFLARKAAFIFTPARLWQYNTSVALPAIAMIIAGLIAAPPAFAEPYRLVAQDRIALRLVEWRSGEGELRDWSLLNGIFLINEEGAVSIPLVGEVEAAGLTTKDLSSRIADLLQQRAGMPNKPFASIEISQYGPIYIVGGVDKPGQYPFNPDLTVMKAISLAGGFQREPESISSRLERDRIQAAGTLGNAQLDYNGQIMRQARLQAEKEGKDSYEIPTTLANASGIDELYREELSLMKLRRVELESKVAAAKDLGELYNHEIETLQSKIEAQRGQIELVKKELTTVKSLLDKGLIQSTRRFSLDREESDAENKLLDLEFQLIRARQSLGENKRDAAEVVNSMNSQIQKELNDVVRDISKSDFQARVARLLVNETDYAKQMQLLEKNQSDKDSIKFRIVRRGKNGGTERINATADSPVEARDLIEVDIGTSPGLEQSSATPDRIRAHVAFSNLVER